MARSRLFVTAFRMEVISSWVSKFSGVTLGFFSFTVKLIQLTSWGMGVLLAQLPVLAYWTTLRKSSLLSAFVDSLFGLLFIWATMCSMSVFVRVLMSAPSIMRSNTGRWAAHFDTRPSDSPKAFR